MSNKPYFGNEELIGVDGIPKTKVEMRLALDTNYIIPQFRDGNLTVDKLLDTCDMRLEWYIPSVHSIDFMNFIRLCLGEEPENSNPKAHYFFMDCIFQQDCVKPYFTIRGIDFDLLKGETVILASREFSKSTLISYLILYMAAKGKMPGFKNAINYGLYVSDSMRNNVKTTMEKLGKIYYESSYLQGIFEDVRLNQDEVSFIRKPSTKAELAAYNEVVNVQKRDKKYVPGRMKRSFALTGLGASTGGRGASDGLFRPNFACHEKGTEVFTDMGKHLVENYYNRLPSRFETGYEVSVRGKQYTEVVTSEHKYWARKLDKKVIDGKTIVEWGDPGWVETRDLTKWHWIGTKVEEVSEEPCTILRKIPVIDERSSDGTVKSRSTKEVEFVPKFFTDPLWWWIYGLWLGDGHRSEYRIHFSVADTQRDTVGAKVLEFAAKYNIKTYEVPRIGCYTIDLNMTDISRWLKKYKFGNSVKNMPEWVLKLDVGLCKEILLGYIAADGCVSKKPEQVRINSVNLKVLEQLQYICDRLGLPSYIRNTKKAGTASFPNGYVCNTRHQYELMLRENVRDVLGLDISNQTSRNYLDVWAEDGYTWRRVSSADVVEGVREFIPITTPDHTYSTELGLSHNCLDDMVSSETDANSSTVLDNIESTIESDVTGGLSGNGNFKILIGTPYNKKDPVYRRIEEGSMLPVVFPRAYKPPKDGMLEEDFESVWPDRHTYAQCKKDYEKARRAQAGGNEDKMRSLMQEHYLRISNDEDRMIPDGLIQDFSRSNIINNKHSYEWVITTDFTTTGNKGSDLSGAALWAVSSRKDFYLIDLDLRRKELEEQYNVVFEMIEKFVGWDIPVTVGVEKDGGQSVHILALRDRMAIRGKHFEIGRQKGAKGSQEGIISRLEGGNKHWRFRLMLPIFQAKKIWFPRELVSSPSMQELREEIKYATYVGFGSRYDDGADLVSMLGAMEINYPSGDVWHEGSTDGLASSSPYSRFTDEDSSPTGGSTVF